MPEWIEIFIIVDGGKLDYGLCNIPVEKSRMHRSDPIDSTKQYPSIPGNADSMPVVLPPLLAGIIGKLDYLLSLKIKTAQPS